MTRLVVTFTTIPSRVPLLGTFLSSLSKQTRKPDVIYLCYPKYSEKEKVDYPPLSEEVLEQVTVLSCCDLGPITKLVPTLETEKDPETLIVTLDDDRAYDPETLEKFYNYAEEYPNCALGATGWVVGGLVDFLNFVEDPEEPVPVDIIQGFTGCLYRRGFFHLKSLLDYQGAPKGAKFHDDIWISGHLCLRGIRRLVVPFPTSFEVREASCINPLSGKTFHFFVTWLVPLISFLKRKGAFKERRRTPLKRSKGFRVWMILLAVVLIIMFLMVVIRNYKGKTGIGNISSPIKLPEFSHR